MRKLAFYEIGGGRFALQMQNEFEKAQMESEKSGQIITVSAKITVYPPEDRDEYNRAYSSLSFEVDSKIPKKKSMKYTTKLHNGYIVEDAESRNEILQLELPDLMIKTKVKEA